MSHSASIYGICESISNLLKPATLVKHNKEISYQMILVNLNKLVNLVEKGLHLGLESKPGIVSLA